MGDSNTVVSAYTMYRYLQQYCSYPSICTTVAHKIHINMDKQQIRSFALNNKIAMALITFPFLLSTGHKDSKREWAHFTT